MTRIAFPGAQGFGAAASGMYAPGALPTDMRTYEVTNTNDDGPGSFRVGAEAPEPRTLVFRTGGLLEALSPIVIRHPHLYIAGQTAPGGGFCIKAHPISNHKQVVWVSASDVIIRHMRFRGGGLTDDTGKFPATVGSTGRSIGLNRYAGSDMVERFILDHCSISWGTDMNIQAGAGANYGTLQYCLIAECLNNASLDQGPHARGMNWRSESGSSVTQHDFSDHHNVYAHHQYRTPMLEATNVEIWNNIVYDNETFGVNINADAHGVVRSLKMTLEAVYFKRLRGWPNTHRETQISDLWGPDSDAYVKGIIGPSRPLLSDPELDAKGGLVVVDESDRYLKNNLGRTIFQNVDPDIFPHSWGTAGGIRRHVTDAVQAWLELTNANAVGATLPRRDAVDARVMADVINGTGGLIDRETQVGGYPIYTPGTAPIDTDHDGIPNSWWGSALGQKYAPGATASTHPSAFSDPGDGYTLLEHYLNETKAHDKPVAL